MKNKIEEIDRNFRNERNDLPDVVFKCCFENPFSLHGFCKPYELNEFLRLPKEIDGGQNVLERLKELSKCTAGGRVRFKTNSPYVAISEKLNDPVPLVHMSSTGVMGFDMFSRPSGCKLPLAYNSCFVPHLNEDGLTFEGVHKFSKKDEGIMRDIIINFPLYTSVDSLFIGVSDKAEVIEPDKYTVDKPVVFCGSSITQGACSSRPGNCYSSILSRELDFDFINLGFSGNAYGDNAIARYISNLNMSAFVLDYDYNARSEKELADTHYSFYETVRRKNPDLPVIMMSAPLKAPTRAVTWEKPMQISRVIIMESYIKGIRNGDKNLYFIDGESLLGDRNAQDSLVDSVHPSDVGFRYMADRIYPVLKDVLYNCITFNSGPTLFTVLKP